MSESRRRALLAFAIPLLALAGGAALVWSISRILLAADEKISPVIGILFALNILTAAGLAATFPRRKGVVLAFVLAVGVPVITAGVVGAVVGEREIESEAVAVEDEEAPPAGEETPPADEESPPAMETPGGEESPPAEVTGPPGAAETTVEVGAKNILFDVAELSLPADTEVTISFHNADLGVPHNVAIYTDDSASDSVFEGEIFPGDATMEYTFTSPSAGTYFFRCDVHPTVMTGTVTVG